MSHDAATGEKDEEWNFVFSVPRGCKNGSLRATVFFLFFQSGFNNGWDKDYIAQSVDTLRRALVVFLGYSSFSHSSYLVSAKWRGWGQGNIEEKEGGGVPHKPLERKRALTFSSPSRGRDERMSDGRKPRRGKMSSPSICIRLSHSAAANEREKETQRPICVQAYLVAVVFWTPFAGVLST